MVFTVKINSLLFLLCLSSQAAITRVQSAKNSTTGTSVVVTLAGSPSNGNNEVICIGDTGASVGQVTSISQTGATWNKIVEVANATGAETEIWAAENVSGAGTTVTVNLGASLNTGAIVTEYSGLLTASSFDVSASSSGTLSTGNPFSGTTATTAQASELFFACFGHATVSGGSTDFSALSNSFSIIDQTGAVGLLKAASGEKIVSSIGTASTTASYVSPPAADTWSGVMATFKAAPVSANTTQVMTETGIGG